MNPRWSATVAGLICSLGVGVALAADPSVPDNPAIDMPGFLRVATEAAKHRESHRVSEQEFIRISREPKTVVLDARSREKFAELHIKGAVNLSFPDISIESLARVLPDKNTTILIYCNNNFTGELSAFPTKAPSASLNLSTFVSLYDYGYRNVYELAPLLDVSATKLELVGKIRAGRRPNS